MLNNYNSQETAESLVKNCKYTEYVDYIIENSNDCNQLYKYFNKVVENEKYLNKEYIAKIYYHFYLKLFLKDNYNNQLLKYFKDRFYEVVAVEKSKDNYRKAATYIGAINKLNDGEKIVNELISELKNSEYAKRTALFDEIDKAIDNK